jgi:hypothetical protein
MAIEVIFHEKEPLCELVFTKGREIAAVYIREHQIVVAFEKDGALEGALTTSSALTACKEIRKFLEERPSDEVAMGEGL